MVDSASPLDEDAARRIAMQAVDAAGGPRSVYGNPRHPFALNPATDYEFEGYQVELRPGEISSPAIVSVAGWVFEIHNEDIELLMKPLKPKRAEP